MSEQVEVTQGELKPCPVCGKHAFIAHGNAPEVNGYPVWCSTDRCLRLPPLATEAEAIAAWNTRAPHDAKPWGYGWYELGGKKMASGYLPTFRYPRSEDVSEGPFPLYRTHPHDALLREAREAIFEDGYFPERTDLIARIDAALSSEQEARDAK